MPNNQNIERDEIDIVLARIGESFLTDAEWANIRPYYWRQDLQDVLRARGVVGNPLADWQREIDAAAEPKRKSEVFIGAAL